VVLHPLAEVGIGMFVPIMVSRRQLVMDILRHGKRRNSEQEEDQADRQSAPKNAGEAEHGNA
jgi:ribosomal 50S subunit-recycling heat shock protein